MKLIRKCNKTVKCLYFMFVLLCILTLVSCREKKEEFSGYTDADFVYISSPFNSKLEDIYVKKGGAVKKGDRLFTLEDIKQKADMTSISSIDSGIANYLSDMQKGVRPEEFKVWENIFNASQIMENIAQVEHNMTKSLIDKNAVTANYYWIAEHFHVFSHYISLAAREQLEALKLGSRNDQILAVRDMSRSVKAQIPYYKYQLDECVQVSPYDAAVFDVLYRKGEMTGVGKPVVILLPPENVKAVFFVEGTKINSLKINDKVHVSVSGIGKPYKASISYISDRSDYTSPYIYSLKNNEKLVYLVEAVFDEANQGVPHPGQPVLVTRQH